MPSINDSQGVDTSNLTPSQGPSSPTPPIERRDEPGPNPYLRCPLPPIYADSDVMRQFYNRGIPQARVILPQTIRTATTAAPKAAPAPVNQMALAQERQAALQAERVAKLSSALNGSGQVTSSTPFNSQGSMVPSQLIVFSYSFTSSSISISWVQQGVPRSDGSTLTLQAGSASYTGLSSSTTYYIYPYISVGNSKLYFVNPSPPPTTPNATYALQTCSDGRLGVPVLVVTTAAIGYPGGGGTGGGGDTCPESAELVDVLGRGQIAASDVAIGDMILGNSFVTGENTYRTVIAKTTAPCFAWRIVNGHRVSPCEAVWNSDTWLPAFRVPGSIFDEFSGSKIQLTVEADGNDESNYWLVSGTPQLIHNFNQIAISPC